MNEPALFRSQRPLEATATELPPDTKQLFMQQTPEGKVGHFEVRNLYGFQMSRATHEGLMAMRPHERPFVLTRSGYAGVQRYAAVWLGDNMSWWGHLARSIPMLLNMGLSGVAFCGVDVGGFGHNCTGELLVRWYEMGIFYPLFRNHCSMHGAPQEPWVFSQEVEDHCRKLIETRYRLLPYIQRLFFEQTKTGAPLMRPLSWHYPEDATAAQIDDQFMFGEDILVAPILSKNKTIRTVYLPEGTWHRFDGSEKYEGGKVHLMSLPLGSVPAFVRDGAILPLSDAVQHTGELHNAAVTFQCYGDSGVGLYYEDDGISFEYELGAFSQWRIRVDQGRFMAQPMNLGLTGWPNRDFRLKLNGKLSAVNLG
jgi:alpha-glucosidase